MPFIDALHTSQGISSDLTLLNATYDLPLGGLAVLPTVQKPSQEVLPFTNQRGTTSIDTDFHLSSRLEMASESNLFADSASTEEYIPNLHEISTDSDSEACIPTLDITNLNEEQEEKGKSSDKLVFVENKRKKSFPSKEHK